MRVVRWSPEARIHFYDYRVGLRREAGCDVAEAWIDAFLQWVDELRAFPRLGRQRPEFGDNVRTRVFRRSMTIAYVPDAHGVTIIRMFGKGRDISPADFHLPE